MQFSTWLAFLPATFLISITPGPNMMLMLALGLQHGIRKTLPAMLGAMLVVLAMIVSSTLGLAVLLAHSPKLFMLVKWAGALYLCWLGLQLLLNRSSAAPADTPMDNAADAGASMGKTNLSATSAFWQAVAVAGSNPKAIVFAASYFPQFIDSSAPASGQLMILLPTFVVIEAACYFLYAASGKRLANWFAQPKVLKNFNRAIGLVFIAFAVALTLTEAK